MESNSKNIFKEVQYLRSNWIGKFGVLVGVIVIIVLGICYVKQDDSVSLLSLMLQSIPFFWVIAIIVLLLSSHLKSEYSGEEIRIKYFPFHLKEVSYKKSDIKQIEKIRYEALGSFGGWGIRFGNGMKCFTVSGNQGIVLTLHNGKKRLIGTKKTMEIKNFLEENGYREFLELQKG